MVVRLRWVIEEKIKECENLYQNSKQIESKKKELEDVINQAIKFVVINTSIGILFKVSISIIPIINAFAQFYYKDINSQYIRPVFNEFYSFLLFSDFFSLFQDLSTFLYIVSISIQLFIFLAFDVKLKTGFDQLMLTKKSVKNK